MNYYSLEGNAPPVSFKEAVINGIARDKGLYFPESINPLPTGFFNELTTLSKNEIAFQLIQPFVGSSIPQETLENIINETLDFEFPLIPLTDRISSLELYHGPTLAFKDVGARFMARCLGYFAALDSKKKEITVLVATSGDTGGAVNNGFLGVEGVTVVILYPSGKVSEIQEKQLTTLGKNITALEVDGTFDNCQNMVKNAFVDPEITTKRTLTSANSINVARWLPQSFYYLFALQQLKERSNPPVFSVPSGNFGNICAGMVAYKLGMPVTHFVASVNSNAVVPDYLKTGSYAPQQSIATISNAMDVGDPSNFVRIQKLFENDFGKLSQMLTSYSFSDTETRAAIEELYERFNYLADPHGAVGYLGLQKYLSAHPNAQGIFLETAHPIKFLDTVEAVIDKKVTIPNAIEELIQKKKKSVAIKNYSEFKAFMLHS